MQGHQPHLPGFEPGGDADRLADEPQASPINPGLMALHSHRAERLLDVVVGWLQQHPLGPLEQEVFIVQSNAVAEWLQMALAQRVGVCAAVRVELPGRFVWRLGRLALGRHAVPTELPMDKLPLTWRLMQHLPQWLDDTGDATLWQPLQAFLAPDATPRLWPLCERLADLYDQYQIYRPDWLDAWAQGQTHITNGAGQPIPLEPGQRWQAKLWERLVNTLPPSDQAVTRPALMQRVLARLNAVHPPDQPLPRRVVAFGMSHLPPGLLEVLGAVSRHSQVLLAVPNPCQYHWADVIDGRQLLRGLHRRLPVKQGLDLAALPLDAMHAHAHPLLAAWGRQSRDFVRLLDAVDDTARGQGQPGWPRLDLFVDEDDPEDHLPTTLLRQVQNAIRDLQPLAEQTQQPSHGWNGQDRSIVFHSAHSPVRELEVLHDQLLALMGSNGLQPKDVVVMVPDMAPVAPAIRAVFGQYTKGDPRFIPFDLADLGAEALSPLVQAWHWLWRLPQERVGLSEWLSLLEVPAVQARFGFEPDDLPRLAQWLTGAGLRWGLHAPHRTAQGLPDLGDTHSAHFAVERMVWGYAVGSHTGPGSDGGDSHPEPHPEPFADVAGLDAALAGSMSHLLDALVHWWAQCQQPATPAQWVARGRRLLQAVFQADLPVPSDLADTEGTSQVLPEPAWPRSRLEPADQAAIAALLQAGQRWLEASAEAGFVQTMPLEVARSAWEHALRLPESDARFHAGGVTFCTLLPMRAIPFRVVCLLGMNDGDYPRRAIRPDLDLIAQPGMARPGDRSRRDDDRQLMLEALLSARDVLYISWCGHSVRDNTEQPPSVLVAQLRDHIAQGWGNEVLKALTTQHPLQPFSPRYLQGEALLFTHAHEWQVVHRQIQELNAISNQALEHKKASNMEPSTSNAEQPLSSLTPSLTLRDLAEALRHPVRLYCQRCLSVVFDSEDDATPDDEPFALDGLQRHQLQRELLDAELDTAPPHLSAAGMTQHLHQQLQRAQRAGQLPLGAPGAVWQATWVPELVRTWQAWQTVRAALPQPAERLRLEAPAPLADWVEALFLPQAACPKWAQLQVAFAGLADATQVCRVRDHSRVLEKTTKTSKNPRPRAEKLLPLWLRSLALCSAAAHPSQAHVLWVAADATLHAQPQPPAEARATLALLVAHVHTVMQAPLPLPPRTALTWLQDPKAPALPWAKLRTAYEGGFEVRGEAPTDPYWSRFFPDLDSLLQDGQFKVLAPAIWGELLRWQKSHVVVVPHSSQEVAA